MKILATVKNFFTVALLLSAAAMAQAPLPDAPSVVKQQNVWTAPFKHATFYVGVGTFAAATIADVHNTTMCEHTRPPQCAEAYQGHDRYGYIAPQIALVAGMTYGCELMLYQHKWWRRTVCPGIGIGLSIYHWKDAYTIYHEERYARP